ncbi:MAG: YfhO family protein [Bacteroidetes bacterium]|nr:YfhO family protein [Bacteroidota bacterium]
MNKGLFSKVLPHLIAVVIFLVVALVYCKPALEGKVLSQGDVTQWKGMFEDMHKYKETHGHLPLWTNGMFSGMPGYQIGMEPYNPVTTSYFHGILSLWLPKPLNFFFLACICFYFLSQVLRVNPYVGIIGSLAYAYATYNPIIISAGHDTKMLAIAYMPSLIGSLILIYERKYLLGAALAALSTSLLVSANHPQITYYTLIIILFMSAGYAIRWIQQKDFKRLVTATVVAVAAAIIGVAANAVTLFTTYEYSKESIRGGSVLADSTSQVTKTGLSTDYALSYSLYKTEPLVLMFPRMYGGSSYQLEVSEDKSKAIDALRQMPQQLAQQVQGGLQFYWGGIDGVGTAGPPYTGAIICFLALVGFVLLDGKHKWWILAATVLAILMSWGKYFEGFNVFLLKYLPMYNKFRAPSMIMVIPNLLLCMMAILTVQKIIDTKDRETLWNNYKKGLMVAGGVFVLALLIYFTSDFTSQADRNLLKQVNEIQDAQQKQAILEPIRSFTSGLKSDRESLFLGDILRTLLFAAAAAGTLWLYIKNKINTIAAIAITGILSFIDVISIDTKYLNGDHYQEEAEYASNFTPSPVEAAIMKDSSFFRVFDLRRGVSSAFNEGAHASYFFRSIGGYHPAKLSIYQDLIENQLYNFPQSMPVVNMLNTKYIILPNQQTGQPELKQNPDNLGPVWFVKAAKFENGPAAVMKALTGFDPKDTVIADEKDKSLIKIAAQPDSAATIHLIKNDNDLVTYQSNSTTDQFAVFSEVYYDKGWKAYIDDKEVPIVRVNYVLRGLSVPAGNHKIKFEFRPASYYTSDKAAIGASALVWLLLIGSLVQAFRKNKKETAA